MIKKDVAPLLIDGMWERLSEEIRISAFGDKSIMKIFGFLTNLFEKAHFSVISSIKAKRLSQTASNTLFTTSA
ncbi:MAG: hypothetical protein KME49_16120 [Brasilonema octagenarum HA4186-MV1]|uniref:Uncharacterized protein n=2 Tax=Brasilonema TaxID=383614 RepID=A0A856MQX9_9CYAN|nr:MULTISPECIES: hypothetical protein [Brasilonema]MBW4626981.1 hypothetical protein [Brasilonema octagenarum HA4186-MV1]NMF65087.1 hypothetical protein [Brasilonema octagenarum UFV-OR1]QDL11837.1 hypothetical protein DP114_31590 [Brasilonema sennae CENA114]QDL18216.1 hypothetical protein DP113_31720 [Brasilonema octagenarum UFV-E1]